MKRNCLNSNGDIQSLFVQYRLESATHYALPTLNEYTTTTSLWFQTLHSDIQDMISKAMFNSEPHRRISTLAPCWNPSLATNRWRKSVLIAWGRRLDSSQQCHSKNDVLINSDYQGLRTVVGLMQPLLPLCLVHRGQVGIVKECHMAQQLVFCGAGQADAKVGLLATNVKRFGAQSDIRYLRGARYISLHDAIRIYSPKHRLCGPLYQFCDAIRIQWLCPSCDKVLWSCTLCLHPSSVRWCPWQQTTPTSRGYSNQRASL